MIGTPTELLANSFSLFLKIGVAPCSVPTLRIVDNYSRKFPLRVSNDVLSLGMEKNMKNKTEKETSQEKAIKLVESSMTKWERRRKRWQAFKVQNNIWQPLKIC